MGASGRVSPVVLLAKRFLLSKHSDGFLSFIAWVSVVGVALGVMALTVVTSVINGFEGELSSVITGMNGDVILYSRESIRDPAAIEAKIRSTVPELQAITPCFIAEVMAAGPTGVAGSILEGIDPAQAGLVTAVPKRVIRGRLPSGPQEVAVGSALADRLGVNLDMDLRVIIPSVHSSESPSEEGAGGNSGENPDGSEEEVTPKAIQVKVVGIIRMGMYDYDSKYIFATLPVVQDLLQQPGRVTAFKLKLMPGTDSHRISKRLGDYFGYPFRAKDWAELNHNLFYAIQLEKAVISIILTVIVIVAAFNVVSTLMMMIHDKTKEIAILKAMGFRPAQGFRLFCLIGLGMGMVGTAFGVGIGYGIGWVLAHTHLVHLPADIYAIGFLPVVMRWNEVGIIALLAVTISFLAALYPGWKVARRSPLDGLRYE